MEFRNCFFPFAKAITWTNAEHWLLKTEKHRWNIFFFNLAYFTEENAIKKIIWFPEQISRGLNVKWVVDFNVLRVLFYVKPLYQVYGGSYVCHVMNKIKLWYTLQVCAFRQ